MAKNINIIAVAIKIIEKARGYDKKENVDRYYKKSNTKDSFGNKSS